MKKKLSIIMSLLLVIFTFGPYYNVFAYTITGTEGDVIYARDDYYYTKILGTVTVHGAEEYSNTYTTETNENEWMLGQKGNTPAIASAEQTMRNNMNAFAENYGATINISQTMEYVPTYEDSVISGDECGGESTQTCNLRTWKIYETWTLSGTADLESIGEVDLSITPPIVGHVVAPVGYTGDDPDSVVDDGTMEPDHTPEVIVNSEHVSVVSAYWINGISTSGENWELLHFGHVNRDSEWFAIITINAEDGYFFDDATNILTNNIAPAEVQPISNNNRTITLIASVPSEVEIANYTLTNGDNEIQFRMEAGQILTFNYTELLGLTEADLVTILAEMQAEAEANNEVFTVTAEELRTYREQVIAAVTENTKNYGTLLGIYELGVTNGVEMFGRAANGFHIKLALPAGTQTFDNYKFLYLDDNNVPVEELLLTRNGDFVEGDLDHLSMYAIVGYNNENPNTSDEIIGCIIMLIICVSGCMIGLSSIQKRKQRKYIRIKD